MRYLFTCLLALTAFGLSAQKLGRPVTFDSIQFVSGQELANGNDAPANFEYGVELIVEGVVCQMHPGYYGLSQNRKSTMLFSKDGSGKWSGVEVMATSSDLEAHLKTTKFYDNFQPGFTVRCKGSLADFGGNTQLELADEETEVISLTPTTIEPVEVTVDMFKNAAGQDQYQSGEPYEHAYVEFRDVVVVDRVLLDPPNTTRWTWMVQDKEGNRIAIRDFSGYYRNDENTAYPIDGEEWSPPAEGSVLEYLRGVIVQTGFDGGGYMIAPLVSADLKIGTVVPLVSNFQTTPSIPESSDDIKVSATITDDGSVVSANLLYAVGIESIDWKTVAMTNVGGDDWEANIGKFADETLIKMYAEAIDDETNTGKGPNRGGIGHIVKVINGGLRKIRDVQRTPLESGESIFAGRKLENIVLAGVVTATSNDLGLTVIQEGPDPYSAIFMKGAIGDNIELLEQGDIVTVTAASVEEDWGVTYLTDITFTKQKGPGVPEPLKDIDLSIFQSIDDVSEGYEGMYMEWSDVLATDTFPDTGPFGEWRFAKDLDEGTPPMRIDDYSLFVPSTFGSDSMNVGYELGFVKGIMFYSHNDWKLLPRDLLDIDNWGFVQKDTSSINEIDAKINLKVFPNPAKEQLLISFEQDKNEMVSIQIIDLSGKVLLEDRFTGQSHRVSVQDLDQGLYFIKLVSPTWSTSRQFIKE